MNRGPLVGGLLAAILILSAVAMHASSSSPCAMGYRVTYSSPFWTVSLLDPMGDYSLGIISFRLVGNEWPETYEDIVNHTGRLPTASELVTYQDRDGDAKTSQGDAFMIWEENATHRTDNSRGIYLYWYRDMQTGDFDFSWFLFVQEGYESACGGPDAPTLDLILAVGILAMVAVLMIIAFILRRRHSS